MSLTQAEYETLLNLAGVRPQLQVNHYFYCDGMPSDVMLRIRRKGDSYLFGYKKLLSAVNGVNVCDERERVLDVQAADSMLHNGVTPSDLLKLVGVQTSQTYRFAGSLQTYRAKFALGEYSIELDKNEYLGAVDYELECECDSDSALEQLKAYLLSTYGIPFRQSKPKSARFFTKYFSDK